MSNLRFPSLPKGQRLPRPPRLTNKEPVAPRGPKIYHRGEHPRLGDEPFLHPPDGFVMAHTSLPEWMAYLAFSMETGYPSNPWQGPFIGGPPVWVYQKAEDGGRVPGGSVSDFVILNWQGQANIGVRIETERFHIWTDAAQQAKDFTISTHLRRLSKVIRIYDQDFIDDPSGGKICALVALALKGQEKANPIYFGTAQRVRMPSR